jgi:FeS assembly SUF system protein
METTTAQALEQDSSATATTENVEQSHANAEGVASTSTQAAVVAPAAAVDPVKMEQLVIDALHSIYDPEIPVDIYELGLIYSIDVSPDGKIAITMTLTTPACPVAGSMPGQVEKTVRMIDGVTDVVVDLVWEPTWGPAMMTEAARLQLNMY